MSTTESREIVVASRNAHKVQELYTLLAHHLSGVTLYSLNDVGMTDDIEENGTTFEENARIKARAALKASGGTRLGLGDDSGLVVDALGGAPGIYSARYAGRHGDDEANNQLLLTQMAGLVNEQRRGRFVCCIACAFPGGQEFVVRGTTEGLITTEAMGEGGFGYDPIFYVPEFEKTFAQMTAREKNDVSHRGRAIEALARRLSQLWSVSDDPI